MLLRLEHTPKLVIAAINGHCVGGGLEIAMAADIRIARKDAGKIGLPEVNLGVLPGTGGTQRLSRLVGKSKAIELMVTGNTFSFEEAQELGIINDIYERDGFMENMMEYAKQFCRPNKAAKAVGRIKRAVQTGWRFPWSRRWRWSARTSRYFSRVKMRRKVWLRTWRRGRRFSRRNSTGCPVSFERGGRERPPDSRRDPSALRRRRYDLTRKEECLLRK